MVLPIFALVTGASCGFSRLGGVIMDRQREVLENKCYFAREFFLQLFKVGINLLTIRALIVSEFDECNWGIFRSPHRSVTRAHIDTRRGEHDSCGLLFAKRLQVVRPCFRRAFLSESPDNLVPNSFV